MEPMEVLRSWAVQDSPPGAAVTALLARGDVEVGWLDRAIYAERTVVALYNARSATAVLPADEVAAYGTALLPQGDEELRSFMVRAAPEQDSGYDEPAQLGFEAISEALDGRELSRDELHAELRQKLPGALLPWCPACESHHAKRGILILAGLRGRLCISGRAGRQPVFARTDQLVGWDAPKREQAGAELVRRYRKLYGDPDVSHFADWAGLGRAQARAVWELAGEQMGRRAPKPRGLRLIATGDPLLLGRDREALVPDEEWRKQVWKSLGGAGVVLVDGEAVGLWKGRKKGKQLEVVLEGDVDAEAVAAEAQRLAPHRGCVTVSLRSA